jgi:hypothetical protein
VAIWRKQEAVNGERGHGRAFVGCGTPANFDVQSAACLAEARFCTAVIIDGRDGTVVRCQHRRDATHPAQMRGTASAAALSVSHNRQVRTPAISRNETLWNVWRDHSGLMPANLTTFAHFSDSAAT